MRRILLSGFRNTEFVARIWCVSYLIGWGHANTGNVSFMYAKYSKKEL
ncbi:hypothetical protein MADA3029_910010 [Vibrio nigripulchritudo MADA3029]|nr:hypothetical protein VIBNIMADA3020_810010 [Vibrio nigripulchritudo MADA3020]CCN56495.1 hypothetical protein VIBNIMADA3021_950106 [Vibrio nigripulchritudo MADA3021]CCN62010.1 hypothetical protein MADA3029_910010 [Vibrio nigripulchritudo MADA3029]